jgi:acetolactate synthase-1/2/3 large subunit
LFSIRVETMRCTGAEALVRLLTAEGVSLAFGIASGKLGPVMHALSRQSAIRFVGVRHDAAAAMMAAAVNVLVKATGFTPED